MRNFIIVGTQRTGSSAIGEAIGLHPDIACGWEWTLRIPPHRKLDVAKKSLEGDFFVLNQPDREHMERVFRPGKAWLGFRRLFRSSDKWAVHPRLAPAIWIDRLESHLRWLAKRPEIHVIHMVRGDNVEWMKSKEMARTNNSYWGREYDPNVKVEIKIKEAVKRLISKNWVDRRLASLSQSNPYLRVNYEDFSADAEQQVMRMFDFLECERNQAALQKRQAKRQSNKHTSEYVSNYSSLVYALEQRRLRYSSLCEQQCAF